MPVPNLEHGHILHLVIAQSGAFYLGGLRDWDDRTKQLIFNLTGITTETDRTWTIGNYSGVPAVPADEGTAGQVLTSAGAGSQPTWAAASGGSSHNLLDGSTHPDTVAQSVSRGSLIVGNSTPKWDELVIGSASTLLKSDGTDASWGTVNLLSAFHGDTVAQAVSRGSLIYGNSTPKWDELVIGGASTLLKSDGTDASWGTVNLLSAFHGDTTAGTVVRGDLITGQGGTPKWQRLAKGTAGQVLKMDGTATDVVWGDVGGAAGGGGQKYLWIPALQWRETAGLAAAVRGSTDGSFIVENSFTGTLDRFMTSSFVVPQGYSAIASLKFVYVDTSTGGQMTMRAGFDILNDADSFADSVTFATKSTFTTPGTSNVGDIVSLNVPSVTLSAGQLVKVILNRNASSDADDTYATTISFVGLLVEFTLS